MNQHISDDEVKALRAISQLADKSGIPLLAVGASAREIVFDRAYGIAPHRSTTDWDFAIPVPDWQAFQRFRQRALESGDFGNDSAEGEQALIHKATGTEIDLIPFGGLENGGRIRWPSTDREMNVIGYREALQKATEVDLATGLRLRVSTVELLVALKVFAAADRAIAVTNRDLGDLDHILSKYPTTHREGEVYDGALVRVSDRFDWDYLPALLLGHDMARACASETLDAMEPILQELSDPFGRYTHLAIPRTFNQEDEQRHRNDFANKFRWLREAIRLSRTS